MASNHKEKQVETICNSQRGRRQEQDEKKQPQARSTEQEHGGKDQALVAMWELGSLYPSKMASMRTVDSGQDAENPESTPPCDQLREFGSRKACV